MLPIVVSMAQEKDPEAVLFRKRLPDGGNLLFDRLARCGLVRCAVRRDTSGKDVGFGWCKAETTG